MLNLLRNQIKSDPTLTFWFDQSFKFDFTRMEPPSPTETVEIFNLIGQTGYIDPETFSDQLEPLLNKYFPQMSIQDFLVSVLSLTKFNISLSENLRSEISSLVLFHLQSDYLKPVEFNALILCCSQLSIRNMEISTTVKLKLLNKIHEKLSPKFLVSLSLSLANLNWPRFLNDLVLPLLNGEVQSFGEENLFNLGLAMLTNGDSIAIELQLKQRCMELLKETEIDAVTRLRLTWMCLGFDWTDILEEQRENFNQMRCKIEHEIAGEESKMLRQLEQGLLMESAETAIEDTSDDIDDEVLEIKQEILDLYGNRFYSNQLLIDMHAYLELDEPIDPFMKIQLKLNKTLVWVNGRQWKLLDVNDKLDYFS
jgi:hypothetical protein